MGSALASEPPSPRLRHNSNPLCLRLVTGSRGKHGVWRRDLVSARTTGFSGLTIRSSRVRFAASTLCGKLVHLVVAAPLPGLAQALGGARQRSSQRGDRPPSAIATCTPCRPHTPCSLKAAALRLWANSLAKSPLAHSTCSVQLVQIWPPCPEIFGAHSNSSLVSRLTIRSSRDRFAARLKW